MYNYNFSMYIVEKLKRLKVLITRHNFGRKEQKQKREFFFLIKTKGWRHEKKKRGVILTKSNPNPKPKLNY